MDHTFFAIPDGSYIVCDEDGTVIFSEAYRLEDGVMEQIAEDGDETEL
jgi:hypothetical protein